jgi:hypothetical protein
MASTGWGDSRKRAVHDSVGKVMLTIVWNPSGFNLINVLPKWFKFNASFYVTQILGPLSDWCRTQVGRTNRKLWAHADNARPHTVTVTLQFMQQSAMRKAPHPIPHTHPIWHPLISISSITSSNFC